MEAAIIGTFPAPSNSFFYISTHDNPFLKLPSMELENAQLFRPEQL